MNIKPNHNPVTTIGSKELLIEDFCRYLNLLANAYRDERTGNLEVRDALSTLARALKPHSHRTVRDLPSLILGVEAKSTIAIPRRRKDLPQDLQTLDCDGVQAILADEQYLKKQIVELGAVRFGIPRARLTKMRRSDAVAAIRAAVDHQQSLAALERQAEIAGTRRA